MGLRRTIKSIFKKSTKYPIENGIRFIHHTPSRGNIGDYLCSPRHYFNFISNIEKLNIIGGGVFVKFALPKLKKENIDPKKSILWGVGISNRDISQSPSQLNSLPYLEWGARDKDIIADSTKFLPCVSCLHSMLDIPLPKKPNTLLFLNADPKVTNENAVATCKKIASENNWLLLFNNCSEKEFVASFEKCNHIITNSYHGSYWGLLAGKKVSLMGYSSKFVSLLNNFGYTQDALTFISRGDKESLVTAIKNINPKVDYIQLQNSADILQEFRDINIEFVKRLKNLKIIRSYEFSDRVRNAISP